MLRRVLENVALFSLALASIMAIAFVGIASIPSNTPVGKEVLSRLYNSSTHTEQTSLPDPSDEQGCSDQFPNFIDELHELGEDRAPTHPVVVKTESEAEAYGDTKLSAWVQYCRSVFMEVMTPQGCFYSFGFRWTGEEWEYLGQYTERCD